MEIALWINEGGSKHDERSELCSEPQVYAMSAGMFITVFVSSFVPASIEAGPSGPVNRREVAWV